MSPRLPRVTAAQILRVLRQHGFEEVRSSGSHRILRNADGKRVTVPYRTAKSFTPSCCRASCAMRTCPWTSCASSSDVAPMPYACPLCSMDVKGTSVPKRYFFRDKTVTGVSYSLNHLKVTLEPTSPSEALPYRYGGFPFACVREARRRALGSPTGGGPDRDIAPGAFCSTRLRRAHWR